jgi:UDP-sulfoquinovose synthase
VKSALKIAVLGGDGFCGWPCALRLARRGHQVAILDNLVRRKTDLELNTRSLTPIASLEERVTTWNKNGKPIDYTIFDLKDYEKLLGWLKEWVPDVIVHFAEQRSAPYSMLSSKHRRYTVDNNVNVTHGLLSALVEANIDAHVVHLGTMGVYGYPSDYPIGEGHVWVTVDGKNGEQLRREILYPSDPGSIYHMTKVIDQHLFQFYRKNWQTRITDLHQGVVWGTQSSETLLDDLLINRFDYDGEYGTVLNRFIVEAVSDHPLTVYGGGEQARAFIHLEDSLNCITMAVENPPDVLNKNVRIFNQFTEIHRLIDLAELVSKTLGAKIRHQDNPRKECEKNQVKAFSTLASKIENPVRLTESKIKEEAGLISRFVKNFDDRVVASKADWHLKN